MAEIVTVDGAAKLRVFTDAEGLFISLLLPNRRVHLPLSREQALRLADEIRERAK